MSGLDVITEDLSNHPLCPHGPMLLFIDYSSNNKFYACSACRNQKDCSFYLKENDYKNWSKDQQAAWQKRLKKFKVHINPMRLYITLNEIKCLAEDQRYYCRTCGTLEPPKFLNKHEKHEIVKSLTDYQLSHPSELLLPLENAKKEAQFLFAKSSVKIIVEIIEKLTYNNILCIGTPRIHEYILNEKPRMNSLLLDLDVRYQNFYGPLEYCWYNVFNHHFFHNESKIVYEDFLKNNNSSRTLIIMDPPFGGRIEPLAHTLQTINAENQKLNNKTRNLATMLIFPYFMEPQIVNSLADFKMCDYKVDYDNHPLFQDGPKGRKNGSPVRIFTNIPLKRIVLPESEEYRYCEKCEKWVANENRHCDVCNGCTSKDGRTYRHCTICNRCVKPTWIHCEECGRCAQADHKCGELPFGKECFHCKEVGHKKRDCPKVDHQTLQKKRKFKAVNASEKIKKVK